MAVRRGQHRNWLVTIVEIHLPFVLWGALAVALAVGLVSALFKPIYRATSLVTLDSDLTKVLKNVDAAFPDVAQSDYIRSEYFAIHNQTLMRAPRIAARFVERHDIRDSAGKRLLPERLLEPKLAGLLSRNAGQGIRVSWVSDTQQFSISGFSRDPERAAEFANSYVELLLEENVEQFRASLAGLEARFTGEIAELNRSLAEVGEHANRLRVERGSYDPVVDIEKLAEKVLTAQDQLNTALLAEKMYRTEVEALRAQAQEYDRYGKFQHVLQVNPQISKLKTDIEDLAVELAEASVEYMPEHPAYQAIERKIATATDLYAKEAEKTFQQEIGKVPAVLDTVLDSLLTAEMDHVVYRAKVAHFQDLVGEYGRRRNGLIALASELDQIDKRRSPLATALSTSYANLAEVQSVAKSGLPFYRVVSQARVDPAELAYYRYFPKTSSIVIAFAAALAGLAFLVVARELHADTLYHGWQLAEKDERLPWADVPTLARGAMGGPGWQLEVAGAAREVFAAVREERLVRVAGALPECGKATVAVALGAYLRNLGESVVLVDADTVRGSLTGMRGLGTLPGLAEVVAGALPAAKALQPEDAAGPAVVPAGQDPPAGRVDAAAFRGLLDELSASFTRLIVVDAPHGEDRLMLAELLPLHRSILVARSGRQSVAEVAGAARAAGGRGSLAGVVVNRTPFEADVLSFRGLWRLAVHLVAAPFRGFG